MASVIVAVLLSLSLTGCGKRGTPEPPPDVPNTFPLPYPSE
jgi:predicted small lipoprotein YifL